MSTETRALAVAGAANCLIMQGLTGPSEFAIVWYTYCTQRSGVGTGSRNILPQFSVFLDGSDLKGSRGIGR